MESQKLYRVRKEDFPKLEELLTQCFLSDPLYCKLIPDRETRIRLMPELFECDLEEFFETCRGGAEGESAEGREKPPWGVPLPRAGLGPAPTQRQTRFPIRRRGGCPHPPAGALSRT